LHHLSSSFILGYHGCDRDVGEALLAHSRQFKPSENDYDWLGGGAYFWEANPVGGLEFAFQLQTRRHGTSSEIKQPYVIGAILDLGFCLDLMSSTGMRAVQQSYRELSDAFATATKGLPANERGEDLVFRRLDCAVINYMHAIRQRTGATPFDTVRGLFVEGGPAYPGAGFRAKTHTQICVRNAACIKGTFRVPSDQLLDVDSSW
jgi:hypothetical protein